jgi:hypothetical protein
MSHQREDVERLSAFSRIHVWNGLGTGKTFTVVWWLASLWMRGVVDEVVLLAPGMCLADWRSSFERAMPDGLVDFTDCRPPDAGLVREALESRLRPPQHALSVYSTTYGGLRDLLALKTRGWAVDEADRMLVGARGRRTAFVVDEAQGVALSNSAQGVAARGLAACCRAVCGITATPVGRPEHLRLWGLTGLVRPDILTRLPVDMYKPRPNAPPTPAGRPGSFDAFKYRFAFLRDPMESKCRGFRVSRAFPVDVYVDRIEHEILRPQAPFTVRRRKEDCLDLPPKVRLMRAMRLSANAQRAMIGLVEDDRAILEDGHAVVPANVLEERLRTIELCGGWLEGRPVHDGKLRLLRDTLLEVEEAVGANAPIHVWASRSREVFAAAMVCGSAKPEDAMRIASEVYPPDGTVVDRTRYRMEVQSLERRGVGVIHGPTESRDRERIQTEWKSGSIKRVVAHPGVAGAGLNWQHSKAALYYSQPLGTIARQQSEDRVHRKGLTHEALIYDMVVENGPDFEVARAHAQQRNAAAAMLDWLSSMMG